MRARRISERQAFRATTPGEKAREQSGLAGGFFFFLLVLVAALYASYKVA